MTAQSHTSPLKPPIRRGRFAPSPSGPLHVGSLYTAVASFLDARQQGGEWLVRIEDVDGTRTRRAAEASILATLEAFGLEWDGPILRQSERRASYAEAIRTLEATGRVYACRCSRSDLARAGEAKSSAYPGTCRNLGLDPEEADAHTLSLRFKLPANSRVQVHDRLQPAFEEAVDQTVGDFIVKRRDGYFSYQLAVVVDDAYQGITDVVRGRDLLDNTARQRLLQQALSLDSPTTLHLPLVVDADQKLSKSHQALPADAGRAPELMSLLLRELRVPMPMSLSRAPIKEQLALAITLWNPINLQGIKSIISSKFSS